MGRRGALQVVLCNGHHVQLALLQLLCCMPLTTSWLTTTTTTRTTNPIYSVTVLTTRTARRSIMLPPLSLANNNKQQSSSSSSSSSNPDILDAEFERVRVVKKKKQKKKPKEKDVVAAYDDSSNDNDDDDTTATTTTATPSPSSSSSSSSSKNKKKTLFDLSLDADPEWKTARVPFIDNKDGGGDGSYIDVKLAFMAQVDGVSYGIGIPHDHAVAMTLEQESKDNKDKSKNHNNGASSSSSSSLSVQNLSPDDEENEELIQIMAGQLHEHVGKDGDLKLCKTPRVLTIVGPLERYTDKWMDKLLPKPVDTETLLDDSDEDLDYFLNFMKKELGEDEVRKTLQGEDDEDDALDEELLALFNVPGLGDQGDDLQGMNDLVDSMVAEAKAHQSESSSDSSSSDSSSNAIEEMEELLGKDLNHEGVALKLMSYKMPDGKVYSLVHLLKPYALVGRYISPEENSDNTKEGGRFELLTPEEEELVVPRLEQVCEEDLQRAGVELSSLQP